MACNEADRIEDALPESGTFAPLQSKSLGVRFRDVAGLDYAKREIRLRMILPMQHPEKAEFYRIRRGGGILLYGPPGTGKTMLAKAVACELSADFYHISPADLITSDVGGAERNVARLFRTIRASQRAVLFLDEIDALVPRRRNNGSTIMLRVISQILGEVDGLRSSETKNDLLLIGATNEIEMVDPAMLRPGRFDAKIYVGPPDEAARRTLLKSLLEELPVADEFSLEELVEKTEGLTGAEIKGVIQKAADEAFLRDVAGGKDESLRFKLDSIESTAEISKYQKRARRGSSSTGKRLEPVASGFERTVLRACSESSGHGESHGDELRRES